MQSDSVYLVSPSQPEPLSTPWTIASLVREDLEQVTLVEDLLINL